MSRMNIILLCVYNTHTQSQFTHSLMFTFDRKINDLSGLLTQDAHSGSIPTKKFLTRYIRASTYRERTLSAIVTIMISPQAGGRERSGSTCEKRDADDIDTR